ncbi:hypothetical protein DICPUDRAFT_92062 [Dictyostelium purpureum]|uniref:Uncharacterized protein n=1 Tax=Dictyostelium purpureum TaxID=5786 RepID=F0ZLG0_DICPU|nr:uncharacterized protein DICPUDRAFT_92062 [Dictyostelium purpureum]EGC35213.1 hypothetical protein DICPUDRAFT_92062 [Dictyostelium purpureum]|eukprot:XP_003288251.1 hypothetical protein DICPUDRAFT_92062 [Dictyostelium purpureum]
MKFLVYIDDKEPSFSAFYRVLNLVKENDWVIIVAKVKFYKGIGHRSSHVMKHFTRLLDKKHIKNLTFIEYGSIKHIIKNKVKLLKIDMILIAAHNSKTKRLCNYCSDNISCNLMVVREFVPLEEYLIPPSNKADYSVPGDLNPLKKKPLQTSESMSSIESPMAGSKPSSLINSPSMETVIPVNKKSSSLSPSTSSSLSKSMDTTPIMYEKKRNNIFDNRNKDNSYDSDESEEEEEYNKKTHHGKALEEYHSEYRLVSSPANLTKRKEEEEKLRKSNYPQKSHEIPSQ